MATNPKVGELIPETERWLHEPEVRAKLDRAIARAENRPLRETDLDELEERLRGGRVPSSSAGSE